MRSDQETALYENGLANIMTQLTLSDNKGDDISGSGFGDKKT